MAAAIAANAVLVLHGLFILWVVLGALAVWRWPRLVWLHLPAVAWGVWIEFSGGLCPLTPLEWHLRTLAGQQGHGGGFIEHYLTAAIYPEGLTRTVQWWLGGFVAAWNGLWYALMLRRRAALRSIA